MLFFCSLIVPYLTSLYYVQASPSTMGHHLKHQHQRINSNNKLASCCSLLVLHKGIIRIEPVKAGHPEMRKKKQTLHPAQPRPHVPQTRTRKTLCYPRCDSCSVRRAIKKRVSEAKPNLWLRTKMSGPRRTVRPCRSVNKQKRRLAMQNSHTWSCKTRMWHTPTLLDPGKPFMHPQADES